MTLGFLGAGIASATAYLGGHLVYGRGVGVDVTTFDRIPRRYTPVMDADALREGKPATADLNGVPLFLLRRGDTVFAMHDRCMLACTDRAVRDIASVPLRDAFRCRASLSGDR